MPLVDKSVFNSCTRRLLNLLLTLFLIYSGRPTVYLESLNLCCVWIEIVWHICSRYWITDYSVQDMTRIFQLQFNRLSRLRCLSSLLLLRVSYWALISSEGDRWCFFISYPQIHVTSDRCIWPLFFLVEFSPPGLCRFLFGLCTVYMTFSEKEVVFLEEGHFELKVRK